MKEGEVRVWFREFLFGSWLIYLLYFIGFLFCDGVGIGYWDLERN